MQVIPSLANLGAQCTLRANFTVFQMIFFILLNIFANSLLNSITRGKKEKQQLTWLIP